MSMATGANMNSRMTPSLQRGKSKGGMTPMSMQKFTPEQMQLFKGMFGQLGPDSFLSRLAGGDEDMFNQLEAPAMRQFGELQGGIASRFSGMGTGARHSSGFQNTMNSAAGDFAQQLQSQRMELQRNAIKDLMGFSNDLLQQRPYEQFLTEKKQPFWKKLLGSLAGPAVQGAITGGTMGYMSRNQNGGGTGEAASGGMDMAKMMPYLMALL
jgi:hypothetical protein